MIPYGTQQPYNFEIVTIPMLTRLFMKHYLHVGLKYQSVPDDGTYIMLETPTVEYTFVEMTFVGTDDQYKAFLSIHSGSIVDDWMT